MSSRKRTTKEEVKEAEVIETATEVESVEGEVVETVDPEPVEETPPKKWKVILKKVFPFAVGAGAVLAAFAIGKHSQNDDLYLAALKDEYGDDEPEEDIDEDDDDFEDTESEEESTES